MIIKLNTEESARAQVESKLMKEVAETSDILTRWGWEVYLGLFVDQGEVIIQLGERAQGTTSPEEYLITVANGQGEVSVDWEELEKKVREAWATVLNDLTAEVEAKKKKIEGINTYLG